MVVLEDLTGHLEVMIWNETFTKSVALLEQGNVVAITGRLDVREEGPRVSANEVRLIKKPAPAERPVMLRFETRGTSEADLIFVRNTLCASPGPRRVEFVFVGEEGRRLRLLPGAEFFVSWSDELRGQLAPWLQP